MANQEEVRKLSKRLFGNRYRLEVAAAIADAEPSVVYARALAEQLQAPANLVGEELHTLADVGLLVLLPRPRGQQQQEFERMPSSYWQLARDFVAELRERSQPLAG
jgi:predicted signal transduction protein with EAL and GGDEF domain